MSWRPAWWLDFLKLYWPLNNLAARATSLPGVGKVLTPAMRLLFGQEHFNISYLPVNANIAPAVSTVLCREVIAELIQRSAHRAIIKRCSCRDSKGCQQYPSTDSCLLLGEDTRQISADLAHHVSMAEALQHLDKQLALGLTPMLGRVRMDDLFYGVPNRKRMLTICFCCPCCCTILNSARYFPAEFRASIVKLEGIQVTVATDKCRLCSQCVEACFMQAITLQSDHIYHDETKCIGCGRCSTVCPERATVLSLADPAAAVDEILGRIKRRINVE